MKISDTSKVQLLNIPDDRINQRLDNLLIGLIKGLPKSRIYRLLRKGEIRINKKRVKADYKIQSGDVLRLPPMRLAEVTKKTIDTTLEPVRSIKKAIIKEKKNWLVLNKPTGLAVHGGSGLSYGVIEGLRALFTDWPFLELVHRLDRETSGVLLLAKKRSTLRYLHQQLREKQMQKLYLCVVHGKWPQNLDFIDAPLEKVQGRGGERIMRVADNGKPSQTRFKLISRSENTSLLQVEPVSGRTHQIRIHCANAGFPIMGDSKYLQQDTLIKKEQKYNIKRLMLHARSLSFRADENATTTTVNAVIDEPFIHALEQLNYADDLISQFAER